MEGGVILRGDCLELLADMEADSMDGCVTDPPYHLQGMSRRWANAKSANASNHKVYKPLSKGFLGQKWDGGDIAHRPETWAAVLNVLKPGSYLCAFAGTRTYHRMACAVEDAGFEIRDMAVWLSSNGFPKSKNDGGRGTALKPCQEPVVLAQKPRVGSFAENDAKYGTGYLNIDEARIPWGDAGKLPDRRQCDDDSHSMFGLAELHRTFPSNDGRWPANVVHDGSDAVLAEFPNTAGHAPQVVNARREGDLMFPLGVSEYQYPGDAGGNAARYFFNAEAVQGEQQAGLKGRWPANVVHDGSDAVLAEFPHTNSGKGGIRITRDCEHTSVGFRKGGRATYSIGDEGNAARFFYCSKPSPNERTAGLPCKSKHPTMKPIELMRWLVRLVVPPEGVVLDPFLGSGTTAVAAALEGRECVGIELDAEYAAIAEARVRWWSGRRGTVAEILKNAPKAAERRQEGADLFEAGE